VGIVLSCFSAAQFIATPILGRMSDRYGRRKIILVSLGGNAFAMGVFALATTTKLLPLLFLSRVVAGLTAGNLSACQAALADVTENDADRASAMGTIGAGIGVGLVLGPVLGGLLSGLGGWAPPLGAASMAFLDLILAAIFLPETRREPPVTEAGATALAPKKSETSAFAEAMRDKRFLAVLLIYFLAFLALSNMQAAFTLLAHARLSLTEREVGHLFGLYGLISVFIQGFAVGRLTRRFGDLGLLAAGAAVAGVGMAMIAFADSVPALVVSLAVYAVGSGAVLPCASSVASKIAGRERQGALLGLAQSAGGAARTIGPTWGGFLFQRVSTGSPFIGGAIASFLAVFVTLFLQRMTDTSVENATQPSNADPPSA
jgi:MFS family permease